MIIFAFASMLIAMLAVVFALQNTAQANVSFFLWSFQGSLALVLLAALFSGILLTFLAYVPSVVKYRWTIRQLRKRIADAEELLAEHEQTLVEVPKSPVGASSTSRDKDTAPAAATKLPEPKGNPADISMTERSSPAKSADKTPSDSS
jgi:putative membrane protein